MVFMGRDFTSGGAKVGVCIRCNCVQIQAGKRYIESLLLVSKDRRSSFSESEGSAVQQPLHHMFFLRTLSWHLETIYIQCLRMSHGVS